MRPANTTIQYDGVKLTKSLQRVIQRQLEKWIERESPLNVIPKERSYEIQIEKEPDHPLTFCRLKIKLGSKTWESQDVGKTIQDALLHAMKHLKSNWIGSQTKTLNAMT